MRMCCKRGLAMLAFLAVAACSAGSSERERTVDRDTLTRRQKDSITAESVLPGADVVGEALETSDAMADRAARMDSISRQ